MKVRAKNVRPGEKYYFPETEFTYNNLFRTNITIDRVNQIVGDYFSTKNEGDRYEVIRYFGFSTLEDCKKYLLKEMSNRKKNILVEYKRSVEELKNLQIK